MVDLVARGWDVMRAGGSGPECAGAPIKKGMHDFRGAPARYCTWRDLQILPNPLQYKTAHGWDKVQYGKKYSACAAVPDVEVDLKFTAGCGCSRTGKHTGSALG